MQLSGGVMHQTVLQSRSVEDSNTTVILHSAFGLMVVIHSRHWPGYKTLVTLKKETCKFKKNHIFSLNTK